MVTVMSHNAGSLGPQGDKAVRRDSRVTTGVRPVGSGFGQTAHLTSLLEASAAAS